MVIEGQTILVSLSYKFEDVLEEVGSVAMFLIPDNQRGHNRRCGYD